MISVKKIFKPRSDRAALHAAIAAHGEAVTLLDAARDNAARLEALVAVVEDCQQAAKAAAREENDARINAVRQGAKFSDVRTLAEFEAKTVEAKRLVERASADAKIARQELHAVATSVNGAQFDLKNAEAAIYRAVNNILLIEAEPMLRRFERTAEEYHALHVEVRGWFDHSGWFKEASARYDELMRKVFPLVRPLSTLKTSSGGNVTSQPPPEVQALTKRWEARAALLRANPDAE